MGCGWKGEAEKEKRGKKEIIIHSRELFNYKG